MVFDPLNSVPITRYAARVTFDCADVPTESSRPSGLSPTPREPSEWVVAKTWDGVVGPTWMDHIETLLFDLDGTLYGIENGYEVRPRIPHAWCPPGSSPV